MTHHPEITSLTRNCVIYQDLDALARKKTELVQALDKISNEMERKTYEIAMQGPNTALYYVLEKAMF